MCGATCRDIERFFVQQTIIKIYSTKRERERQHLLYTPSRTNMEPKNGGLEDDFLFQRDDFHVPF